MGRPRLPTTPHELLLVEWVDSLEPVPHWRWIDEVPAPSALHCISVGYRVAETDSVLALAPNLGCVGSDRLQASGIIRIPKCCIGRMVTLI